MTRKTAALAATLALACLASSPAAQAGSCPRDRVLATPRSIESKDSVGVEVTRREGEVEVSVVV